MTIENPATVRSPVGDEPKGSGCDASGQPNRCDRNADGGHADATDNASRAANDDGPRPGYADDRPASRPA